MSLPTMMTTSEKAIQKSMTRPRLSVYHTNFLGALCQVLVRHHPPLRGVQRSQLTFFGDHGSWATVL